MPWLQPYQSVGQVIEREWRSGLSLPQALSHVPNAPVRFPWARVAIAVSLVAVLFGAAIFFTRKRG